MGKSQYTLRTQSLAQAGRAGFSNQVQEVLFFHFEAQALITEQVRRVVLQQLVSELRLATDHSVAYSLRERCIGIRALRQGWQSSVSCPTRTLGTTYLFASLLFPYPVQKVQHEAVQTAQINEVLSCVLHGWCIT